MPHDQQRERDDHDRGIRSEERLCQLDADKLAHAEIHKLESEALALQAAEYERRLADLNHEAQRIAGRDAIYASREFVDGLVSSLEDKLEQQSGVLGITLPREVFDTFVRETYKVESERREVRLVAVENSVIARAGIADAVERDDVRLKSLEDWKARAAGFGALLAIISGVVGAAIARALG